MAEGRTNPTAAPMARQYPCTTQDGIEPTYGVAPETYLNSQKGSDSLVLGLGRIIPRWDNTPARTIRYFVQASTFPSNEDAQFAAAALEGAAQEWNDLKLGITLQSTTIQTEASFYLVYRPSPSNSTTLAQAFFPNEVDEDVIVYSFAFEPDNKEILQPIFLHELGHVLGLRHEFAIEQEGEGAVQFMQKNPQSVMSYNFPPTMQDSDREGTKAFYQLENGARVQGRPVTDYVPQVRDEERRFKRRHRRDSGSGRGRGRGRG